MGYSARVGRLPWLISPRRGHLSQLNRKLGTPDSGTGTVTSRAVNPPSRPGPRIATAVPSSDTTSLPWLTGH